MPKRGILPSVAMAIFSAGDRFSLRRRTREKSIWGDSGKLQCGQLTARRTVEKGKGLQMGIGVQMLDFNDKLAELYAG